jgi:hypothetical protein
MRISLPISPVFVGGVFNPDRLAGNAESRLETAPTTICRCFAGSVKYAG